MKHTNVFKGLIAISLLAGAVHAMAAPMLKADVSPNHFNRLHVKDHRIISAKAESFECQVEADIKSGDIYIKPQVKELFRVFVTLDNIETHLVELRPIAQRAQDVVLRTDLPKKIEAPKLAHAPSLKEKLTHTAQGILKGDIPMNASVSKSNERRIKTKKYWQTPETRIETNQARFTVVTVQNRTRAPLSLKQIMDRGGNHQGMVAKTAILPAKGKSTIVLIHIKKDPS